MNLLANAVAGLKSLFQKERVEHEMDEELESFVTESAAEKQRAGMTADAARRAAMVELGSGNAVKHLIWSSRWESTAEGLLLDLRIGLRSLVKSPAFTLVAIVSLALGIGANTAIFTLIHQVLLRNLPVRDPQQLVSLGNANSAGVIGGVDLGFAGMFPWSFARQLEASPGPFQGIAAYCSFSDKASIRVPAVDVSVATNTSAILAPTSLVSGNYFNVLGAQPLIGRAITPADDATPGSGAVAVLSYHFWQQTLSSDRAIVGKTLNINGTPFDVIGVMPEGFHGVKQELEPPDLWTPVSMQAVVMRHPSYLDASGPYFLHLFGRLSQQAATNKAALAESQNWLIAQVHDGIREREGGKVTADRLREIERVKVPLIPAGQGVSELRNEYGNSLKILMVVVVLVLLIACANLANFLLARAATQQREIATRLALGSSRGRIVRQSLIETMLLSLAGGALGLAIAFSATRSLVAFVSRGSAYIAVSSRPDATVLLFTLGVSLLTGLFFGLAPAMVAAGTGAHGTLSAAARTAKGSDSKAARFWPKVLVTAQVVLSLLLLVGAGLFLGTLRNLQNENYGFERTHLLVAQFLPELAGYKPSQTPALHQALLDRISALPGVRSAALAVTPPISAGNWSSSIGLSGYVPAPKENRSSLLNRVSGKYFETSGISMVAGRPITDQDTAGSLKVAVINETIARHCFPKGDALGHMLTIDIDDVKGPWQIVGIAADTRSGNPRNTSPIRMTYIPLAQIEPFVPADPNAPKPATPQPPEENQDRFARVIVVRTVGDPAKTESELRAAVAGVDPNLPLLNVSTIGEQVEQLMEHDELVSTLTALFAGLALVLAAIGLYGVMSYNVARRTNEIGIRLALGAQTRTLRWMILRESLLLLAIGVAVGLPVTLAATRLIRQQFFGLSATDPTTFSAAILVVGGMTVLASWLPARRATRVDPMAALRCD